MARKQTAGQITETAMGLIDQIGETAIAEARKGLAARLAGMAKGTRAGDQEILDCLEKGLEIEITEDIRLGIALAAEWIGDRHFDY